MLAGIEMCRSYRQQYGFDCIGAIPANVFGPGDDFSLESSHVIPAISTSNAPRKGEQKWLYIDMGVRSSKKGIPVRE